MKANLLAAQHCYLIAPIVAGVLRGARLADRESLDAAGLDGLLVAAESFDPSRNVPFEAWAKFKIRGAILNRLQERIGAALDDAEAVADPAPSPEARAIAAERVNTAVRAIERLEPAEKAVLMLRYADAVPARLAAEKLGITPAEFERLRRRGIRRLRNAIYRSQGP